MISVVLLLIAFSVDWAKTCKGVNYKYTAYKNKEFRGSGCPKGCFGYHNTSSPTDYISSSGDEWKSDHWERSKCEECSKINREFILTLFYDTNPALQPGTVGTVSDTELEIACNGWTQATVEYTNTAGNPSTRLVGIPEWGDINGRGCFWDSKKKKCGATSCPNMASIQNCNGNWTNGKCVKNKGSTCLAYNLVYTLPNILLRSSSYGGSYYIWEKYAGSTCPLNTTDGTDYYYPIQEVGPPPPTCPANHGGWISCNDLDKYYKFVYANASSVKAIKFTADDVKQCNYRCENPRRGFQYLTYDYSIGTRKKCNNVYGCLYSDYSTQSCSYWAIWAFILFLVLVILFFIAVIVVIVIIVVKLRGKKTTKVEDGAAQSKAADSAAPVDSAPPPPSGPYVVIKLGKQEKLTKKVESSVWGESVVFTGLGAEDDDVEFELHDNSGALLGNVNVRIPEYVNAKKRATLSLKSGEAAIGTLETDIEIQVQEEPEVKITGVFYVDKFIAV